MTVYIVGVVHHQWHWSKTQCFEERSFTRSMEGTF